MKKPVIFALRGAVGFGLAACLMFVGTEWVETARAAGIYTSPGTQLGILFGTFLFSGLLGATVLYVGSAHWIRAALGFGVVFSPALGMLDEAISMAREVSPNGPTFDEAMTIVVIWSLGPAVYAGLGGLFKRLALGLPGTIAFVLPGLLLGPLTLMIHYHGSLLGLLGLPVSGALFGYAVGRQETAATLQPCGPVAHGAEEVGEDEEKEDSERIEM